MKLFEKLLVFFGLIAFTTQDLTGRKGCDCSICKDVDNRIQPLLGKMKHDERGKPGCNICEHKKEMLRMEKEREKQLQKCPFEILGAPSIKGKTSEEIFDEFRELIVPSQNGFFDMMRGVVKTMHVSSEAELKYAKEKEARELAKKKAEEAEAQKANRGKPKKEEKVESPKVTVVLKQKPCGQFMAPEERVEAPIIPFLRRLPKQTVVDTPMEEEVIPGLQLPTSNMNEENVGIVSYSETTQYPQEVSTHQQDDADDRTDVVREESNDITTETESPFVKFMTNEEFRELAGQQGMSVDDLEMQLNEMAQSDWGLLQEDGYFNDGNNLLQPAQND